MSHDICTENDGEDDNVPDISLKLLFNLDFNMQNAYY